MFKILTRMSSTSKQFCISVVDPGTPKPKFVIIYAVLGNFWPSNRRAPLPKKNPGSSLHLWCCCKRDLSVLLKSDCIYFVELATQLNPSNFILVQFSRNSFLSTVILITRIIFLHLSVISQIKIRITIT